MNLAETTWPDAGDVETDLAVLPVGSTEQHGPHAPLGTDTTTATAVAREGVDRADTPTILAPPIPVGIAAEHRQFPGTLWVSEDSFRAYVRETCQSLAAHGWDRIVIVNGHGGNVDALRELCGTLVRVGEAYAVPFTWFDAVDTPGGIDMGHGGPVETSLVRHVDPDSVDADRFAEAAENGAEGWGEWQSSVNLAYDTAEFSENGTVGDPTESSPALGEQLLDDAASKLADLLAAVDQRDVSRPPNR
jgi:creatinine amidohydrolase